jgi:peptidoglycan/xylan/chitin deacetylase (PgdA/CDA1 family)
VTPVTTDGAPFLVLMYHRVASPAADPYNVCVTPERFEEQMAWLAANHEVVPLADISSPSRTPRVAITFDDGYRDNLAVAEHLSARGMPASFFIVAGQLGSTTPFWWDGVYHCLTHGTGSPSGWVELEHVRLLAEVATETGRER